MVEDIICNKTFIIEINFYHNTERLVAVGSDDEWGQYYVKRREVFNIAQDEQLFGCELEKRTSDRFFCGVTWLKWKITN